jgi:hypothetical protein
MRAEAPHVHALAKALYAVVRKAETSNPQTSTLNPLLKALNPDPSTPISKPSTLSLTPKP